MARYTETEEEARKREKRCEEQKMIKIGKILQTQAENERIRRETDANRCVICGEIIPEGGHVCSVCTKNILEDNKEELETFTSALTKLANKIRSVLPTFRDTTSHNENK